MVVHSKNARECRLGYNRLVSEAEFQKGFDEERQRQVLYPPFSLMDTNTSMLPSKGSVS